MWIKIELPEGYNFIPYTTSNDSNVPESKIIITEEDGQKYITVTGKVIWKRKEEYFTLNPGKVKLDYTWPSVVEDEQGHFKKLFNVNGYFNSKVVLKILTILIAFIPLTALEPEQMAYLV